MEVETANLQSFRELENLYLSLLSDVKVNFISLINEYFRVVAQYGMI